MSTTLISTITATTTITNASLYSWPVTIKNSTPTTMITVTLNIPISKNDMYFKINSDYITITSTLSIINLTNTPILHYPGLVTESQNYTNIVVENISIADDSNYSSRLLVNVRGLGSGWICGIHNNASVNNCSVTCMIGIPGINGDIYTTGSQPTILYAGNGANGCGGIAGDYNTGPITNCINNKNVINNGGYGGYANPDDLTGNGGFAGNGGSGGGGIVGNNNSGTITSCSNQGFLLNYGGAGGPGGVGNNENNHNGYISCCGGAGGSGGGIAGNNNSGEIINCVMGGSVENYGGKGGDGGNGGTSSSGTGGTGFGNGDIGYNGKDQYINGGAGGSGGAIVGDNNSGSISYCSFGNVVNNSGGAGGNGGAGASGGESGGNGGAAGNGGAGGSAGGIAGNNNSGLISQCFTNDIGSIGIFNSGGAAGTPGAKGGSGNKKGNSGGDASGGNGGSSGAIAGDGNTGTIQYCYTNVTIECSGTAASTTNPIYPVINGNIGTGGGLVGNDNYGLIQYCYCNGTIKSQAGGNESTQSTIGYICGQNNNTLINYCYTSSYDTANSEYYFWSSSNSGTNSGDTASWASDIANATINKSGVVPTTIWNATGAAPYTLQNPYNSD